MSDPKCKSCKYYQPYPIVKMEGECSDTTKIIYIADKPNNEPPHVFDFSSCQNHESNDT